MDSDPDTLTVDIDGWEGPLDLLLALARTQKVDLKQISILALVEQYLDYVEHAKSLKLELAAFIDCIRSRQAPRVGGAQAAKALEIAMKITEQIAQQNARS